ncbi:phage virion morphogenesis protein [Paracoccaceae bacterium Fryx2]|nr:phage virion morphogenesis protein [Paracoccaceae bacterium Fryx2]
MITIELKDEAVTAALSGLEALLADLSPVMNEIGDFLVGTTEARFESEQTPDGATWAPRSAATVARYQRRRWSYGKVLHLTGAMSSNIAHDYGPDFVEVGLSAIQAAVMQFGAAKGAFGTTARGGSIPWGTIPARPFLGLSDADRTGIIDIVGEWLDRAASGGD